MLPLHSRKQQHKISIWCTVWLCELSLPSTIPNVVTCHFNLSFARTALLLSSSSLLLLLLHAWGFVLCVLFCCLLVCFICYLSILVVVVFALWWRWLWLLRYCCCCCYCYCGCCCCYCCCCLPGRNRVLILS